MPQDLLVPPPSLTPTQRRLFRIAALLVAATRLFAMASSPWDWDEVQFMAGVREFDVTRHHPHPAGFPIYILLANVVQLSGTSDFRSLQVVSFLAACSLFPLAFLLARELRLEVRTSFLAALLFVFLPNVWYYGGTVFSDITGTALNLAAIVMLLRGCRDGRAFLLGCALVGCALSVRPHGGFILLPPLLVATWYQFRHHRAFGRIAAGAVITATIAVAAYAGAAFASESPRAYVESVRHFQQWVHDVDTVANPGRTPLRQLADEFLVRPMGAGRLSMIVTALAAAGVLLAGRRKGPWIALLTFLPYMIFAWLMHDPVGYHRYSTAYVAVYALLAAFALERMTAPLQRFAAAAQIVAIVVIAGRYAWWTLPALQEVRSTIAPTHAASTFAQALVPKGERIWLDDSMSPWGYYLADRTIARVQTPAQVTGGPDELFLTEGLMREPGAHVFRRARGRVAEIHPERHFEAAVAPVAILWRFGEGWGDPEGHQDVNWRWMSARSVTMIPAPPGKGRLTLTLAKPTEIESVVVVRVNDVLLERFAMPAGAVTKTWDVEGLPDALSKLEIATSATLNPRKAGLGGDPRDLGLQLLDYRWQPLR